MWTDAILAYLHFMAIFGLFVLLAKELMLFKVGAANADIGALAWTDGAFGMTAGIVLLTGAARAVFGVKGWAFYEHNVVFHIKIGLFVLIALISILPTVSILRWRKSRRQDASFRVADKEWNRARRIVLIELHLLALLPLAAVIMARGLV